MANILSCLQGHFALLSFALEAVKHRAGIAVALRFVIHIHYLIIVHVIILVLCSTTFSLSGVSTWNCDLHHMFMRTVSAAFECSRDQRIQLNVALLGICGSFIKTARLLVLKF